MKAVIPALAWSRNRFYLHGLERAAPIVAVLLSTWLSTAAPAASSGENTTKLFDAAQPLRVRFQDALLSLEAAQNPWTQVSRRSNKRPACAFIMHFRLRDLSPYVSRPCR